MAVVGGHRLPAGLAAGEFEAFLRGEMQRNEKIARAVGLKID